jgi:hypothetical protein
MPPMTASVSQPAVGVALAIVSTNPRGTMGLRP